MFSINNGTAVGLTALALFTVIAAIDVQPASAGCNNVTNKKYRMR